MDYFRGLTSVLSNSQPETQPSPADTVERLLDRVQSSGLLEDRRDACRGLRSLSKKYRLEVGAQGLETLVGALDACQDPETASYILDTLCNITSSEVFEEETSNSTAVGEQFTEILLKKSENITTIINWLEEYDFQVRLPAIRLLLNLLVNKPKEMQEIVLVSPMGVAKLMDIFSDSREFVRNEALLLLTQLTRSNANIQKIVAFEDGFIRLFQVIQTEGYSDGGIVVFDCLQLMLNLLKNNLSNQTSFREGGFTKQISVFFQKCLEVEGGSSESVAWSTQKIGNVHSMFQVVRTLVSPSNSSQVVEPAQKAMTASGLLPELCRLLLMSSSVPIETLCETICTVAEIIRGCQANQDLFAQVKAPSPPSRTALVGLLLLMVNDKKPLGLRTAILYCLQCYLFRNETGQMQIMQGLLPSTTEARPVITPGQLLCMGLFTDDALSHWLSSVSLSHNLVNNVQSKELLLNVHLAWPTLSAPISLLQLSFNMLEKGGKVQSRLGVLILLSTWLAHCPNAVSHFVRLPNSIGLLMAQVGSNEHDELEVMVQSLCAFLLGLCLLFNNDSNASFTRESLCQLITRRIGVETFLDKLAEASKHEVYSKALKHPQIHIGSPEEVQLDYEFCRLYRTLEAQIVKVIAPSSTGDAKEAEPPSESELKAVAKYNEMIRELDKDKETIREQEEQIQHLRQRLAALEAQNITTQSQLDEARTKVENLQDQNALLKAQRNNNVVFDEPEPEAVQRAAPAPSADEVRRLEQQLDELRLDNQRLLTQLDEKARNILAPTGENGNAGAAPTATTTNTCSSSFLDSFQIEPPDQQQVNAASFPFPASFH